MGGTHDVTDDAPAYLFEPCRLASVTLRDVLLLLDQHIATFDYLLGNWCKDYVCEGLKTLRLAPEKPLDIDFLELRWQLRIDYDELDNRQELSGFRIPDFTGVGKILTEDVNQGDWKVASMGERIFYALGLTPVYELVDYPLLLNYQVEIIDAGSTISTPVSPGQGEFTLGNILYGVIWGLAANGSPSDRDKLLVELKEALQK